MRHLAVREHPQNAAVRVLERCRPPGPGSVGVLPLRSSHGPCSRVVASRDGNNVVFEVITGMLDGRGQFASHGSHARAQSAHGHKAAASAWRTIPANANAPQAGEHRPVGPTECAVNAAAVKIRAFRMEPRPAKARPVS